MRLWKDVWCRCQVQVALSCATFFKVPFNRTQSALAHFHTSLYSSIISFPPGLPGRIAGHSSSNLLSSWSRSLASPALGAPSESYPAGSASLPSRPGTPPAHRWSPAAWYLQTCSACPRFRTPSCGRSWAPPSPQTRRRPQSEHTAPSCSTLRGPPLCEMFACGDGRL